MCLPAKSQDPSSCPSQGRSIAGVGALTVLASLGGPAIASGLGALDLSVLVGAGAAIAALALCAALAAATVAWRRRSRRRELTPKL
jgi:hypothetical protein